jgi:hypothetical protein
VDVEESVSDGDIRVLLKTDHSPKTVRISTRKCEIRWTVFRHIQTLHTRIDVA